MKRCYGCMEEVKIGENCSCSYIEGQNELLHVLASGTLLNNRYLLGRVLGIGGFGVTYLAWDELLHNKVAIKEFFPKDIAMRSNTTQAITAVSNEARDIFTDGKNKFFEEARLLLKFKDHPNIVRVSDIFEANHTAYIVMDYIEGVTLKDYLQQKGGKLDYNLTLEIMMPVIDALSEVHSVGLIHRDVSPDNIYLTTKGMVKLLDFGAARHAMADKSMSLSVVLKQGYAPIEQYSSKGKQGPWTDVYAVAATIYRCICGKVPVESIDRMQEEELIKPSDLGVAIDKPTENMLMKAMAIKANERFQSMREFQGALASSKELKKEVIKANKEKKEEIREEISKVKNIKQEKEQTSASPTVKSNIFAQLRWQWLALGVLLLLVVLLPVLTGGLDSESSKEVLNSLSASDNQENKEEILVEEAEIDNEKSQYTQLKDLPIGSIVRDTAKWEHRGGAGYTHGDGSEFRWDDNKQEFIGGPLTQTKPVEWIVVAKKHSGYPANSVTLVSKELIGMYAFDNSTDRVDYWGSNHWGNSGTTNATAGIRPWLNTTFYNHFSSGFKNAILTTNLANKDYNGNAYTTSDKIFIPSTTELGDTAHARTYPIGSNWGYFTDNSSRIAQIGGSDWQYWTRSLNSEISGGVRYVDSDGSFNNKYAYYSGDGVRPALNLQSDIYVNPDGELVW